MRTGVPRGRLDAALQHCLLVIPSINGGDLLARMLPSVRLKAGNIIVLDQGSTDRTAKVCADAGVEVLQLHTPRSYTECCNIALQLAEARGCQHFVISNNDVRLVTDVVSELMVEMLEDEALGIVACSQVILSGDADAGALSYRVGWDLEHVEFHHDFALKAAEIGRLESDFCELTFALISTAAARAVGGFDDDFGFYHEDGDFGYRLRQAGYSCAYLPQSQIQHFSGSTFQRGLGQVRLDYIERSRGLFARKHLGRGFGYSNHKSDAPTSWNVVNRNLHPSLTRYGLVDQQRPELIFSHPGTPPFDFLYSVWETSKLPVEWTQYRSAYARVFVPSLWNLKVFKAAGFENTLYVPLGVETDVFNPWRNIDRSGPVFLWFARDQHRKGLDVMLVAWRLHRANGGLGELRVVGHGVLQACGAPRSAVVSWREFMRYDDRENGISYLEIVRPLTPERVAELYAGSDHLMLTSRSEGFGFSVVECMACGRIPIFPDYGATSDMCHDGALTFSGRQVEADYSDKLFFDVGHWWEPDPREIASLMARAERLSSEEKRLLVRRGLNLVRSRFTWRNTCSALARALESLQTQHPRTPGKSRRPGALTMREFAALVRVAASDDMTAEDTIVDFSGFDPAHYKREYRDIAVSGPDPLVHYVSHGWLEDRSPSPHASTRAFLASNPRAAAYLLALTDPDPTREAARAARLSLVRLEVRHLIDAQDGSSPTSTRLLEDLYRIILGRAPDEAGRSFYLSELERGAASADEVAETLLSSDECAARLGRPGVVPVLRSRPPSSTLG